MITPWVVKAFTFVPPLGETALVLVWASPAQLCFENVHNIRRVYNFTSVRNVSDIAMEMIRELRKEFDKKLRWALAGEGGPKELISYFDQALQAKEAEVVERIAEWAAKNRCSCKGRIHDPEDLMGKLLQVLYSPSEEAVLDTELKRLEVDNNEND